MSKTKMLLDVVQDMRSLADSLQAMADAIVYNMDEPEDVTVKSNEEAVSEQPMTATQPDTSVKADTTDKSAKPDKALTSDKALAPDKSATPKLDLVTLRAKVAAYSTPENRPKIRDILSTLGVKKLTELSEEQYPVMLAEVEKVCRM